MGQGGKHKLGMLGGVKIQVFSFGKRKKNIGVSGIRKILWMMRGMLRVVVVFVVVFCGMRMF